MSELALDRREAAAWFALPDDGDDHSAALAKALRDAERDPAVRCVVLRGGAFDLDATGALVRLRATTLPTIAAWTGDVRGTGAPLLLACDLRVAAHGATLDLRPPEPPAPPPAGVSWQLARSVGRARAFDLLARARPPLGATELLDLGLVSVATGPDDLDASVGAIVGELAAHPRAFVAGLKRSLSFAELVEFDESVEFDGLLDYA